MCAAHATLKLSQVFIYGWTGSRLMSEVIIITDNTLQDLSISLH